MRLVVVSCRKNRIYFYRRYKKEARAKRKCACVGNVDQIFAIQRLGMSQPTAIDTEENASAAFSCFLAFYKATRFIIQLKTE